jgi:diphthamide biosynthesis methyltransferase
MRYIAVFSAAVLLLIGAALPSVAHHSFAAEYDATKPVTLTGKVTKVEWQNPHTYFYIDVKDAKTNETANWAVELGSPNSLMRLGWTRKSMKVDETVTVQGSLAKDGSKLLNARTVALASTGQRLLTGSSEDTGK